MSINIPVKTGEVIYIHPEELTIMVVMSSESGFRYIEPMNPKFDDYGNVITTYVSYYDLPDCTISLGNVTNISATLIGKKS